MCRCRLGSTAAGTRHFRRAAPRSAGKVGSVQLLRSLTRDPGHYGGDPAKTPLWTIFYETLIHDFDTLLWLNPAGKPVEVTAVADALIRPDFSGRAFTVPPSSPSGSIAVAEANFLRHVRLRHPR